jgi:hypothetical protein
MLLAAAAIAAAIVGALTGCIRPAAALSEIGGGQARVYTGLVCDRPDQVERFMALNGPDNAAAALAVVNAEAGKADACVITTYFARREAVVGRIQRDGGVLGILRMKVVAVRSPCGLVLLADPALLSEPVTWFSIEPLPEADL